MNCSDGHWRDAPLLDSLRCHHELASGKKMHLISRVTRVLESNEILRNELQKGKKKCKIPHWKGKMLLSSSEAGKFLVCTAAGVKNVKLYDVRKAKDSTSWIQNPTFTDSFSYPFIQSILVLLYIFITCFLTWLGMMFEITLPFILLYFYFLL